MKTIDNFLIEAKFITPIDLNSGIEIRFVIKEETLNQLNIKNISTNCTDSYMSSTFRYRVIDKSSDPKYEDGNVFRLISDEEGSTNKNSQEIDIDTMKTEMSGEKIILEITKKGIGVLEFKEFGVSGYCERVISRAKSKIIFDEIHIEFEDLKTESELEILSNLLEPEKIFQCTLFQYSFNNARVKNIET